jgi:hypothetical protein
LQERENLDSQTAKKIIDGELWLRIMVFLTSQYNDTFGNPLTPKNKPGKKEKNCEKERDVLTPGTPFHKDFMPIFRIFSKPQQKEISDSIASKTDIRG